MEVSWRCSSGALIAARDGVTDGLVCVFDTIEPCRSFRLAYGPGRPTIRPARRKRLFRYFYCLDAAFGLCHVRVQTWFPFTLQVYVNGHEWLARQMDQRGLRYRRLENALLWLEQPGHGCSVWPTASPPWTGRRGSTASPPRSIRSCATSSRVTATTGRRTRPSMRPTVRRRAGRRGRQTLGWHPLPKGVAFLPRYATMSAAANHRYLDALAVVDDPAPAHQARDRLVRPRVETFDLEDADGAVARLEELCAR